MQSAAAPVFQLVLSAHVRLCKKITIRCCSNKIPLGIELFDSNLLLRYLQLQPRSSELKTFGMIKYATIEYEISFPCLN